MRINYCKSVLSKRAPLGTWSQQVVTWCLAAGQRAMRSRAVLSVSPGLAPRRLTGPQDRLGAQHVSFPALTGSRAFTAAWALHLTCCRCDLCHRFHRCPSPSVSRRVSLCLEKLRPVISWCQTGRGEGGGAGQRRMGTGSERGHHLRYLLKRGGVLRRLPGQVGRQPSSCQARRAPRGLGSARRASLRLPV